MHCVCTSDELNDPLFGAEFACCVEANSCLNFVYHMVNWMTVTLNVYLNFYLALVQKMSDLKLILFGLLVISYALIR